MDQSSLMQAHYRTLSDFWASVLERTEFAAIAVAAGHQQFYLHDDQGPAFRPNPLLVQWLAKQQCSENSWFIFSDAAKPLLLFHQPEDFWHAATPAPDHLDEYLDVRVFADQDELNSTLEHHLAGAQSSKRQIAQISEFDAAVTTQCVLNPTKVIHALHFQRGCKTEYELALMRQAAELGARGHRAAQQAFADGASEFEIHLAFLRASGMNEWQLPYGNIIAQNEHASLLHYQYQDRDSATHLNSLLIDAGANVNGYASDITRTHVGPSCYSATAKALFSDLLERMQTLQDGLIAKVTPGANYVDLQAAMHRSLASVLTDTGILTCSAQEAFESELTVPFCPHGLGHLLGIQVHDVGGQQLDIEGQMSPPPENYASLRLTRPLAANMVITVEPGVYFIPMLLERKRATNAPINWALVDLLTPFGGIRVEDNVRLLPTGAGIENMTRDAFAKL
ncbi:MAG: Xaa-Pro dipeptidase [Proteobacteria bacterium]|nr:Xaa-Pro dipeptidase [Pseudomonadota bacterium]